MPTWIKPETPEHRRERLGTNVDPGINPDPDKHFWRFGKSYHIERFDRKWAAYDREEGTVRPHGEREFRVRDLPAERKVRLGLGRRSEPQARGSRSRQRRRPRATATPISNSSSILRPQFFPLDPAKNDRTIRFEESSDGLPQIRFVPQLDGHRRHERGWFPRPRSAAAARRRRRTSRDLPRRWQGSLERVGRNGCRTRSTTAASSSADFNKDGHKDMAFSVHLTGIFVYPRRRQREFHRGVRGIAARLSDAASDRRRTSTRTVTPTSWRSREGPTAASARWDCRTVRSSRLINQNKGKSWEVEDIAPSGVKTGGDWLSAGQFNDDGRPDFVIGSIFLGSRDIFFLSKGPNEWAAVRKSARAGSHPVGRVLLRPTRPAGSHRRRTMTRSSAYVRYWPGDLDPAIMPRPPLTETTSIDRVSFAKDGTATRTPIARWGGHRPVTGLALADFDGDGNLDIIYARLDAAQEAVILLGDGKGGFTRASVDGARTARAARTYDLKVADVNGDRKPDVILMYESGASTNAAGWRGAGVRGAQRIGACLPQQRRGPAGGSRSEVGRDAAETAGIELRIASARGMVRCEGACPAC